MTGLAEFLLARIAEDEEVARAAAGSPFTPGDPGADWVAGETNNDGVRRVDGIPVCGHSWPYEMDHIARWDPARVLAECDAKRRMVERVSDVAWAGYAVRDVVLELLALPHVHHPDYDPSWRP